MHFLMLIGYLRRNVKWQIKITFFLIIILNYNKALLETMFLTDMYKKQYKLQALQIG